jgi:hypothetical protein
VPSVALLPHARAAAPTIDAKSETRAGGSFMGTRRSARVTITQRPRRHGDAKRRCFHAFSRTSTHPRDPCAQ